MDLKINPIVATLIIAGALILCFAVFKGCKQAKKEEAAKEKVQHIADSALAELKRFKSESDSTKADFDIQKELLIGQVDLLENKLGSTEGMLDKVLKENHELIDRYESGKWAAFEEDTGVVITVPNEYVRDCKDCFDKLGTTTTLSLKYKADVDALRKKMDDQGFLYQNRITQLGVEKSSMYNKMQSLATQAKDATDKLKPHGRLYLSWGVLWSPWPVGAGVGLMYQTKRYFQYGAKVYYGNKGTTVETSMHFPLSIKF